jgi:excisionase family DNA binding protein
MERLAVSAVEAGKMLGVSDDTVRRLVESGHLPRVPHLSLIRIPVEALRRFAAGEVAA